MAAPLTGPLLALLPMTGRAQGDWTLCTACCRPGDLSWLAHPKQWADMASPASCAVVAQQGAHSTDSSGCGREGPCGCCCARSSGGCRGARSRAPWKAWHSGEAAWLWVPCSHGENLVLPDGYTHSPCPWGWWGAWPGVSSQLRPNVPSGSRVGVGGVLPYVADGGNQVVRCHGDTGWGHTAGGREGHCSPATGLAGPGTRALRGQAQPRQ